MMAGASVQLRLRQAILLDDLPLVQRLLKNNPQHLHNPDFGNKSNTSLHLAAENGFFDIAEYLISLGHDRTLEVTEAVYSNAGRNHGISINTDGHCAIHLAALNSHAKLVRLLCRHFPQTINRSDKLGRTPLLLAAAAPPKPSSAFFSATKSNAKAPEDIESLDILLRHGANTNAQDEKGNTCLHNACAWGNLKAVRALIQAGADPLCSNYAGWTPEYYSLTVQAEVYFRNLVAEFEKRKAEEKIRAFERKARGGGALRMVVADEDESEFTGLGLSRDRADSGRSTLTTSSDGG